MSPSGPVIETFGHDRCDVSHAHPNEDTANFKPAHKGSNTDSPANAVDTRSGESGRLSPMPADPEMQHQDAVCEGAKDADSASNNHDHAAILRLKRPGVGAPSLLLIKSDGGK